MTSIVRNQWYVAAYGSEVGRELFSRTVCGESILFWRTRDGAVTAMSDRCVHRRFPLSRAPSRLVGDTVVCGYHGFTYDADGACVAVPGQTRVPRTARLRVLPGGGAGQLRLGLHRRPGAGRRRPRSRARRGWPGRAGPRCAAWSRSRPGLRPAGRQPHGPLARDLPARRLHRHARGRRHADHHRGRRGGRDRLRLPAHGRRRVPAVLREEHRHRGPDHPLAGHRVHPALPLPAAQPDRAGRRRCRTRTAPTRTRSTSRSSTRSPRRPSTRRTTSGRWPATSPSTTRRCRTSCARATAPSSCRTSTRSTCSSRCIAGEPDGYQELSINIDTGGLAARRLIAALAGSGAAQPAVTDPVTGRDLPPPREVLDGERVMRVNWVPGSDRLRGRCSLRRRERGRRPGRMWEWLLAHPDHPRGGSDRPGPTRASRRPRTSSPTPPSSARVPAAR